MSLLRLRLENTPFEAYRLEPYRYLFFIGLLHLLWGIGLWAAFALGWVSYPGPAHARLMVEGFLLSFSLGFLMTAVPRFSRTTPAAWPEALAAGALALAAGVSDLAAVGALLFLVAFGYRRKIFGSKIKKPSFFIFIQGGLFFGLAGAVAKTFFTPELYAFKSWLYEGMMMMWLCGIGSRILVMLMEPDSEPLTPFQNRAVFATLFAGIFIQPFGPEWAQVGDALRFVAILYLCVRVWRVHALPRGRGALAWGVWMGVVALLAGQATRLVRPELGIHAAHLIFAGGFCTLALMVAVRVSIAHSGDSLAIEKRYRRVTVAAALLIFAGLTRFVAGILPAESYFSHLAYASITLLAAIPLWASVVLPRLTQDEGSDEGSDPHPKPHPPKSREAPA